MSDRNWWKKIPLPEKPELLGGNSLSEDKYEEAVKAWTRQVNQLILDNIPSGCIMKSCEFTEVKTVKNFAEITLEKIC